MHSADEMFARMTLFSSCGPKSKVTFPKAESSRIQVISLKVTAATKEQYVKMELRYEKPVCDVFLSREIKALLVHGLGLTTDAEQRFVVQLL